MRSEDALNAAVAERRAVVDIGSNSVRLVIYDGPRRAPFSICNEKALCGLGRAITPDGLLEPEATGFALTTLKRFARLIREHGHPPTHVIATAAVREAKDGAEFVEAVRSLGFDVQVISGAEEASLAAMGVVSFEPGATGIAGDMGGGSLELVCLDQGAIAETISLPLGPFSVMREAASDTGAAQSFISRELDRATFLTEKKHRAIYAVGGAWRAVARIHMRLRGYPLSVLHHYELTSAQVLEICDLVSHQSRQSLESIPGIPRRRLDTLPYAAMVLASVLERTSAKKLIVSAGGVREGLLYRALCDDIRREDPFISCCRFYAKRLAPDPEFGEAAFPMLTPLFHKTKDARLLYASCLLMDIGAYFHPDQRAQHAFDAALRAPFAGVSHEERVWTALAVFCRYDGRPSIMPDEQVVGLLSWEEQLSAIRYGLAMRFAAALSPKAGAPLHRCSLERDDDRIIFRAPADREDLMGETPRKRLDALAAAFEMEAIEIYEG
ncbi:MAG: Ppx/GppA phosphatase family protein [Hyphococcus sp.]